MKRLTVTIDRDEDALAIVQLLMQGADKAVDFRLETVTNTPEHTHHKRPKARRLENTMQSKCWEVIKDRTDEFTVKDVQPIAVQSGMAKASTTTLIARWREDGFIVCTGMRGRMPTYSVARPAKR